ncbi:MAG: sulfate reduction electron transfer complex DsrMKJOP subunit DsrJ [Candidatus Sulfopaludibacter sp.]|nr:sulfate reduction electron transfer complex DsrMKJOP subunit DsrJ [Candidatus Sulfopaludibacter sp.]
MRDRGLIYSALALFLGLVTFPAWHNLSAHVTGKGPEVRLPVNAKQCVAPVEYMRTSHMNLLIDWRETVVRTGRRDFTAAGGKHYNMSLTPTCLEQCHGARKDFCDRCHDYAAVSPPCWNCHQDAKAVLRSAK